jgi:hypothetical protein
MKIIKFDIAKREAVIANIELARKDAELKLTTLEMNSKDKLTGMWTQALDSVASKTQ